MWKRLAIFALPLLLAVLSAAPAAAQVQRLTFQAHDRTAIVRSNGSSWEVRFPLTEAQMGELSVRLDEYYQQNQEDPAALMKALTYLASREVKRNELIDLINGTFVLFTDVRGEINLSRETLDMIEAEGFRTPAAMALLTMIAFSDSPDGVRIEAAERIREWRGSLPKQEFNPSIMARTDLHAGSAPEMYDRWVLTALAFGEIGGETAETFLAERKLSIGATETLARFATDSHRTSSHAANVLEETACRFLLERLHDWEIRYAREFYSSNFGFAKPARPNFNKVLDGRTPTPEAARLLSLLGLFRVKDALETIRDGLTSTNVAIQGGSFYAAITNLQWKEIYGPDGQLSDLDPSVMIRKGEWIASARVFSRYFEGAFSVLHYPTDPEPPRTYWPVKQAMESTRLSDAQKAELLAKFLLRFREGGRTDILYSFGRLDIAEILANTSEGARYLTEMLLDPEFENRLLTTFDRKTVAEIEKNSMALVVRLAELKSEPASKAVPRLEEMGWIEPPREGRPGPLDHLLNPFRFSEAAKKTHLADPLRWDERGRIVDEIKRAATKPRL